MAALAAEMERRLAGSRVQAVYQPFGHAVVLHLYGDRRLHRLVADVEPTRLCVGLLQDAGPPNPPVAPAFCMLLRKYLEGARLVASACRQGDRILYLGFHRSARPLPGGSPGSRPAAGAGTGAGGPALPFPAEQADPRDPRWADAVLIVELTGRGANIFLQSGGRLAGWLRPPSEARGLRVSEPYRPPRPSPVDGPAGAPPSGPLSPSTGGEGLLDAFGRWWAGRVGHDRLEDRRRQLLKSLHAAISRLSRRLEHQVSDLAHSRSFERWLEAGQLLLAYANRIPRGSRQVTLPPPDQAGEDRPPMVIDIHPELGPVENARLLFRRYRKARRAVEIQQAAAETTRQALFSLELACSLAREATSVAELERIEQELPDGAREALDRSRKDSREGGAAARPPRPAHRQPRRQAVAEEPEAIGRLQSSDGILILVGRTATANDRLTLRLARPDDLWLHARGVPGAHVVVRFGPADPPERTLLEAAVVAARCSSAGTSAAAVEVDVTRRRHVRKPPGAPPGFVLYDHERTIRVRPDRDPGPPASYEPRGQPG